MECCQGAARALLGRFWCVSGAFLGRCWGASVLLARWYPLRYPLGCPPWGIPGGHPGCRLGCPGAPLGSRQGTPRDTVGALGCRI